MIWFSSWWSSGAQKLRRSKLACRWTKNGFLGAAGSAGSGGGALSLPELGGTFRWVAGSLVMVEEGSNWVGGCCGGSLLVWSISSRRWVQVFVVVCGICGGSRGEVSSGLRR